MPSLRDFRRRIRGVQNTRKITHAMELVAVTKMRRAVSAVHATRRYAQLAWSLLNDVQARADVLHHPLLHGRSPVRRTLLLVVGGNRGLVGAFNQRVVVLALSALHGQAESTDLVVTGRVASRLLHRAGARIVADFPKKDLLAEPADAKPIADLLLRQFLSGKADVVRMVYTDYVSTLRHEPRLRTLLPLGEPDTKLGSVEPQELGLEGQISRRSDFLFEPSATHVLEAVVPNLLSIQVYQALLETTASEHAARMVTMQSATKNADELADELTLTLNQVRQQHITRELQEIVSASVS